MTDSIDIQPDRRGIRVPYRNLIALVAVLLAVGANYMQTKIATDENAKTIARLDAESKEHFAEVRNGNPDQERRITALEAQKADKLAVLIEQQGKQIETIVQGLADQAKAQQSDHDLIVKLAAVLESQSRKN